MAYVIASPLSKWFLGSFIVRCQSLFFITILISALSGCGGSSSSPPDIDTLEDLAGFYTIDSASFLNTDLSTELSTDDTVNMESVDVDSVVIEITDAGILYLYQLNNISEMLDCVISTRQQQLTALGDGVFLFENLQDDFAANQRYEVTRDSAKLVLTNILDSSEMVSIQSSDNQSFLNDVCVYRITRTESFNALVSDVDISDREARENFILENSFLQAADGLELYAYNEFGDVSQVETYDLINNDLLELELREYSFVDGELVSHRTFKEIISNMLVVQDEERIFQWENGLALGYDRIQTEYSGTEVTQEIVEEYINVYSDENSLAESKILRTEEQEYIHTEYVREGSLLQTVHFFSEDAVVLHTINYIRDELGRVINQVKEYFNDSGEIDNQKIETYDFIETFEGDIILGVLKYDALNVDENNFLSVTDVDAQYYELANDCGRFYPVSQGGVPDQVNPNRDCFSMNVNFLR